MAVKQTFARIDIERRTGLAVQRAKSHELFPGKYARRCPVALPQIIQQGNALFEVFQILSHSVLVPMDEPTRSRPAFPGKDGG